MQQTRLEKAFEYWKANPVEAVKEWFKVTPTDYQGDIINALLKPTGECAVRVAAKSGHGVGKTTLESWCGWVFLMTRPHSRIPATAPTINQLCDVLWPEFAKWHQKMPEQFKGMWEISATHIRHKKHDKTWFATARTSNKPDNLQGFHNEHVLVLVEEASGVPANIFEPIEGILSNAEEKGEEALLLMVGNPTQTAGEFFNAFGKNKALYERFTISGDTTLPDDKNGGRIYISPRVTKKYRETMAAKYGRDSAVYDVRVRGLFPKEADDVVIPLAWAEAAQYLTLPHYDRAKDPITLVMDVARFGGDETVLSEFRLGHCIKMEAWPKTSTNQCADILHEAYYERADRLTPGRVVIDEPGVGGGVVDTARRDGIPITPYNGGRSMVKGVDPDDDVRMFFNRRSRDWWYVRRIMERKFKKIPIDETLVNQLASVKYDYVNEKIKVETKKEMRERLGEDASPDRADTIIMGMAPYVSLENAIPLELWDLPGNVIYGEERPTANMDF